VSERTDGIFDAVAQDDLDVTSADMLKRLYAELRQRGIEIYFAEVHAPVLEFGRRAGLLDVISEDHIFPTVPAAVAAVAGSVQQPDRMPS
jgi:MFS superfamily sulfate permease-like transporter